MIRLFRVFVPTSVVALVLLDVAVLYSCFILTIRFLTDEELDVFLLYDAGLMRVSVVVITVLLGLYFLDMYSYLRIRSKTVLIQQICLVVGIVFLAQAVVNYVKPDMSLPQSVVLVGCGMVLAILPPWRVLYSTYLIRVLGGQKVLFIGDSPIAQELADEIEERRELGLSIVGYLSDSENLRGVKCLGVMADLRPTVERFRPDRIVVALSERRQRLPVYEMLDLRLSGVRIEEAATLYEAAFCRIPIRELRPSQLIFSAELGPKPISVNLQTIYSNAVAAFGLVVALPLMVLVGVAVRLTSPGPVFYRQTRVGLKGRTFTLYKFRSMRADAEAKTGAVWAQSNDPRITPLGKWLRKLRIDELPQLLNVLKGDMSIVGPRPERPEFVRTLAEQIPFYNQRHCVKPGITGWAQINHKYGDTLDDTITKLEYDLYYIKHLAPSLDGYIMFHTAKVMLLSRGAQ